MKRKTFGGRRKWVWCALLLVGLFTLGVGGALAVGETTGTAVACATATAPGTTVAGFVAHGVTVPDVVVPDSVASHCETTTYTIPTTTQTVPGPTTTVTSTVTTTTPTTTAMTSTTTPTTTTAPTTTTTSSSPQPTGIAGNWTMTFDDEFNGTSLDRTKWEPCWFVNDPSRAGQDYCGSMNNTVTYKSNVTVANGEASLALTGTNKGAMIDTNPSACGCAGFQQAPTATAPVVAEFRVWLPGDGTNCLNWTGPWTNGQSWPSNGENDIAETLLEGGKGVVTVNYHSSSGAHNQGAVPGYWCGGYHTYTLERENNHADVYFDGALVKSYTTDDNNSPQYLLVDNTYGQFTGGLPTTVKVDYVRAWKAA